MYRKNLFDRCCITDICDIFTAKIAKTIKILLQYNMNRIKIICFLLLFTGTIGNELCAQQEPTYSQYMLNPFLINPAAAGSEGTTSVNLTGREQWVGINGAPSTYTFTAGNQDIKK